MANVKSQITVRVQTRDGMKRIQLSIYENAIALYQKVFSLCNDKSLVLFKDRLLNDEIPQGSNVNVKGLRIQHGDIIYVKTTSPEVTRVTEDEIDVRLSKESGLILREKDQQLCRHNDQGKCLHCSPIEPYDEEYLKSMNPPAKHLSFHAYLKKLKSGVSKGKFLNMENIDCKIKSGCTDHPPWPKGICTKCQPSAILLNRQKYRHVDNIMFENPVIMDRFLNFWRTTGCQRVGYMYGRYEKYDNIPLGIRATVSVIYEPPQESSKNHIELLEDSQANTVDKLAEHLGLRKVGWIFTDLLAEDDGQVKHLRHSETHFLSAQECIMAAHMQNSHPNIFMGSSSGKFGSKFVTVVVSGHQEKHIHYDGWQVSNQCMALVNDECLVPTIDDPALGYIKESSSQQYVPDVFYKETDTYGNDVTCIGRPMPMEFFLIEVPAAFPIEPVNMFVGSKDMPFPIENRQHIGETQDFDVFVRYIKTIQSDLLNGFLDFHFLLHMFTNEMLPLKNEFRHLCKVLVSRDKQAFKDWCNGDGWRTVEKLVYDSLPVGETMDVDQSNQWICQHCTFLNELSLQNCEMCHLPKV